MNRILAVSFILFCFEIGIFLVLAPWSGLWDNNFLLSFSPGLRAFALSNFTRGAVSGLGVIDCLLGISELHLFWKSLRLFDRPTE